jgi:hypothetical protein
MTIYCGTDLRDSSTITELTLTVHSTINGSQVEFIGKNVNVDSTDWELEYDIQVKPLDLPRFDKALKIYHQSHFGVRSRHYGIKLKSSMQY